MTLALADELFLVTRDLHTGRPRVPEPALGIGLGAAVLAELVFAGAVVLADGRLVAGELEPPDELTGAVLAETRQLHAGDGVPVDQWLADRRHALPDRVADRMVAAGELRREERRRLGRTLVRYLPADPAAAFLRAQRLGAYVRTRTAVTAGDATLTGLVTAVAPDGRLLDFDAVDLTRIRAMTSLLPAPLRELLAVTEALVRTARGSVYV